MFFVNLKAHYEELSVYEQEVIDYLMKQDNIEAQTLKSIGRPCICRLRPLCGQVRS